MKEIVVAQQVIKILENYGIEQAFTVTGGAAMHLNKFLGDSKKINVTYMHHEQSCAIAAEGYARLKNKPALVVVTAGPGVINSLNGVFGAFTDSVPMIVIAGQSRLNTLKSNYQLNELRQLGDQEIDSIQLVSKITKWQKRLVEPEKTEQLVTEAFSASIQNRPGPSWLEIPVDIQGTKIKNKKIKYEKIARITKNNLIEENQINEVHLKLANSKRPLILAGSGVRLENQIELLQKFSKKYQIPISTAWTHDLIESSNFLFAGRPGTIGTRAGNFVLQNCDLLIILGSRLNIRQIGYNHSEFAKDAFKIWVDIDRNELMKPFPITEMKIESSIKEFLDKLDNKLKLKKYKYDSRKWLKWINKIKIDYAIEKETFVEEKNRINSYKLIPEVINNSDINSIIVCGNATACIVPFQTAELKKNQRIFSNSGSASMGYDLPAAIGASLADKKKQIICFAGDGSLMMNLQELQTLKYLNLNIKLFILENNGYLSIKQTQKSFFNKKYGSDKNSFLTFPNFEMIAKSFKLKTKLLNKKIWKSQIKNLLATKGPVVIVAPICITQEFTPRLKSKMTKSGIISPPLDDMYPNISEQELNEVRKSAKR